MLVNVLWGDANMVDENEGNVKAKIDETDYETQICKIHNDFTVLNKDLRKLQLPVLNDLLAIVYKHFEHEVFVQITK